MYNIVVDELFLENEDMLSLDFFLLSTGTTGIRISEKLKKELETSPFKAYELGAPIVFKTEK